MGSECVPANIGAFEQKLKGEKPALLRTAPIGGRCGATSTMHDEAIGGRGRFFRGWRELARVMLLLLSDSAEN